MSEKRLPVDFTHSTSGRGVIGGQSRGTTILVPARGGPTPSRPVFRALVSGERVSGELADRENREGLGGQWRLQTRRPEETAEALLDLQQDVAHCRALRDSTLPPGRG